MMEPGNLTALYLDLHELGLPVREVQYPGGRALIISQAIDGRRYGSASAVGLAVVHWTVGPSHRDRQRTERRLELGSWWVVPYTDMAEVVATVRRCYGTESVMSRTKGRRGPKYKESPRLLQRKLRLGAPLTFSYTAHERIIVQSGRVVYVGRAWHTVRDPVPDPEEGWESEEEWLEYRRHPTRVRFKRCLGHILKVEDQIGASKAAVRYYSPPEEAFEDLTTQDLQAKLLGQVKATAFYLDLMVQWVDAVIEGHKDVVATDVHNAILRAKRVLREIELDHGEYSLRTNQRAWERAWRDVTTDVVNGIKLRPHATEGQIKALRESPLPSMTQVLERIGGTNKL